MTREQAKNNLIAMGLSEPTDDAISAYLNQISGEVSREKARAEKYKEQADLSVELQNQLDEINSKNMSDIEKITAERDKALKEHADLQKAYSELNLAKSLAEKGIVGDDASNVIKSILDGDYMAMTETLGKIISDKSTEAVAAKEKEWLHGTPNPNGGASGSDNKTTAETLVSKIRGGNSESNNDVLANYL